MGDGGARRRTSVLVCVAGGLFAGTAFLYWPACEHGFVNYDDDAYVTDNPEVLGGLRAGGMLWALTSNHASNWHPLTWWSLQCDAALFGSGPRGFHRTNVLFHSANAVLLLLALHALTGSVWRAAIVAFFFAVHPQHVESVAWVSERKDVLSTFFFLLTLLIYSWYVAAPSVSRMVAVAGTMALGLAAKPMLVTLPCVLLLLDFWPLRRVPLPGQASDGWWQTFRPVLIEKLPLFALAALAAGLTLSAQTTALQSLHFVALPDRVANGLVSYVAYLGQTIYPTGLAVCYPHPRGSWMEWQIVGALVVLAALTGLAFWQAPLRPYLLVGWLWYLGTLVPVIGLVQVGEQSRADRYMYLPHIGLFVACVWWVAEISGSRGWLRTAMAGAAIGILAGAALLTRDQIALWRDSRTLWEHALAVTKDNYTAEAHLADLALKAGDKATAAARVERFLQMQPIAEWEQGLAELLVELNRPAEAIAHYKKAVALKPERVNWQIRLAGLLFDLGQLGQARDEYAKVVRLDPGAREAYVNLGRLSVRQGKLEEAASYFAHVAGAGEPKNADAVLKLGHALAQEGSYEEAAAMYTRALQLDPGHAAAHYGRGNMSATRRKWAEAVTDYREAIRLAPKAPSYRFALAHALDRAGRPADAEREYASAMELATDWPERVSRSAWQLATDPDPAHRLGPRAVLLAEQASEARRGRSAELLDVLAASYAEVGRWEEAVAVADRGATTAQAGGRSDLAVQIRSRRDLYKERKPYRQPASSR
jgi:tetratricopeptide (TPR) repeat protein